MDIQHKILLVDDDEDLLEVYRGVLSQLPGHPAVQTANSGQAALALLEASPFHLLVTDLRMPRMDGLQVISVVRRKYPSLRTVVLTSLVDEQFRSRVYALGVDLFWQKPATDAEMSLFREAIQSLIERQDSGGFRGLQSKSLMDIVQFESMSQSSLVLRITNGPLVGRVWLQNGELIDAEGAGLTGEAAFLQLMSWKNGGFDVLPPDPNRPRAIHKSVNGLLLESAQAMDEARQEESESDTAFARRIGANPLKRIDGFEFLLPLNDESGSAEVAQGIANAAELSAWARTTLAAFRRVGDELHVGQPDTVVALGRARHLGLAGRGDKDICTGWHSRLNASEVRKHTKKANALWAC